MAELTPLSLATAEWLGRAFGLDVVAVEAVPLGSVNSNFCFRTRDGGVYFARIYEEQARAGAETETRLLRELARAGVPVVAPLVVTDPSFSIAASSVEVGAAVIELGNKPFAIFPWVAGEWFCHARVAPEHCRAVGAALASVHCASAHVPALPPGRFRPSDMLERLGRIEDRNLPQLASGVGRIRRSYDRYLARRNNDLPHGICHGDLFRDNVLFDAGRLVALLDFESASWGSFIYDLAVTALAWCFTDGFLPARLAALFEGYGSVRPLAASERAALATEAALGCLRFATTRITDFELRAAEGQAPGRDFRRFLARLDAIEAGALAAWGDRP